MAEDERRAESLGALVGALAPALRVAILPAWDCLPFDRIAPSRRAMGRRMGVLRWLLDADRRPHLLVTTPGATLQRVPPPDVVAAAHRDIRVGDVLDLAALARDLSRIGYIADEQVDDPGAFAVRGRVVDIFAAAAPLPCRIEHDDGRVIAIRSYHPATQRSEASTRHLIVDAASELVRPEGPADAPADEHHLAHAYPRLATVFDYLADAALLGDAGAMAAAERAARQILDAKQDAGSRATGDGLYLDAPTWRRAVGALRPTTGQSDEEAGITPVPRFASEPHASRALGHFLRDVPARTSIVLAAANERHRRGLQRVGEAQTGRRGVPCADWPDVLAAPAGALLVLAADLPAGFVASGLAVVAAPDVFGDQVRAGVATDQAETVEILARTRFALGDVVVHIDHGVAILDGLVTFETGSEGAGHAIRLRFADDARLMVPVDEIDRVWRYGSDPDAVALDKLDGTAWPKRRRRIEEAIAETAVHLAALAAAKAERRAPALSAPPEGLARVAAGFRYAPTPDQAAAFETVHTDLAQTRPMDRLVCGDVGFGKTEVALRAAAIALLAGKQVALVAPTTVLVRQHVETFRRRFAPLGIEVAQLSRVVPPAEAKRVKAGLADGSIRLVVGTQALAGRDVAFADLGLTIIDEEQRFGARDKARLRAGAEATHLLTLTATPIPRTLQMALAGLQDISLLATPPVQRQAIRTLATPFAPDLVRDALAREKRRGGQSLVVCPRVEDIEPVAAVLRQLVPDLALVVAHGKMPAQQVDAVMVAFADGGGDVLLATNIIETGLDIPNANTMLVWRADLFGLAQLHQLRGRVGRGTRRGAVYLLSDPDVALSPAAQKRLTTIERHDRVGGGFSISAEDLDQRGAGDLVGDTQAGHVKLIGLSLYQTMLAAALEGRGADLGVAVRPDLRLGLTGRIPHEYVADDEVRLNLYARLAAPGPASGLDAFAVELEDRFGPIPPEVALMLRVARLRNACEALDIVRLESGPQAVAATPRHAPSEAEAARAEAALPDVAFRAGRFVRKGGSEDPDAQLAFAEAFIDALSEGPFPLRGRPKGRR